MFYFHPENLGREIQFDEHIFQLGWFNHQLDAPQKMTISKGKACFQPSFLKGYVSFRGVPDWSFSRCWKSISSQCHLLVFYVLNAEFMGKDGWFFIFYWGDLEISSGSIFHLQGPSLILHAVLCFRECHFQAKKFASHYPAGFSQSLVDLGCVDGWLYCFPRSWGCSFVLYSACVLGNVQYPWYESCSLGILGGL